MYIYLFGSLCRGELDEFSDIDLLVVHDSEQKNISQLDTQIYSIYSEKRLLELWDEGNPFAWHLFKESTLVYSLNNENLIQKWGEPNQYVNMEIDLRKFSNLFYESLSSIESSNYSLEFDLSMLFLSIRNFATCYSLGFLNQFNFSRKSALMLESDKLDISSDCFSILERARIMSTRGIGNRTTDVEIKKVKQEIQKISDWFDLILRKI